VSNASAGTSQPAVNAEEDIVCARGGDRPLAVHRLAPLLQNSVTGDGNGYVAPAPLTVMFVLRAVPAPITLLAMGIWINHAPRLGIAASVP